MNTLDELLTAAAPAPEVSPQAFSNGRAALDSAIRTVPASPAARARRPHRSWLSGLRARLLIGTAVAAAGAAVAAAVVLPSSPARTQVRPVVIAPTSLTAKTVLSQAARAAAARAGWPDAQYWYSEDKYLCDGQLYTDRDWIWRYGSGVAERSGPSNGPSRCTLGGSTAVPINDSYKFGPVTWSQLFTLPTNPAALRAKLMADFGQGGGAALFGDVLFVLEDSPAPPAVRAALFKVDASIPGVQVTGRYTDPLGRTGIALRIGRSGIVVDPASGEVIDDIGSGVMYLRQGPVDSEPQLGRTRPAPAGGSAGPAATGTSA